MVWWLQIMIMHVFPWVEIVEEEDGGEEGGALDWKNLRVHELALRLRVLH